MHVSLSFHSFPDEAGEGYDQNDYKKGDETYGQERKLRFRLFLLLGMFGLMLVRDGLNFLTLIV